MNETFGQHIRSLREERGLTQRSLSQAVGFKSLAHLSDIESGKRNPAKESLQKFAKALGVPLAELESRDTRSPIEAAKALFARKPEMVAAFLKIIEVAKKLDAEELVERVTQKPRPADSTAAVPTPIPAPTEAVALKPEPPKAEPPKAEPPKAEPPKAEPPKAEPPKAEPPKAEPPKAEPPKAEPPKAEPPKAEPPKVEPPKAEPPKAEPPKAKAPVQSTQPTLF